MIISHEALHIHINEIINALNTIKDTNFKVIFYVRKSIDLICSMWQQGCKTHDYKISLKTFILNQNEIPFYESFKNLKLNKYINKDNYIVRPFEKEQFVGGNLITDFCDFINIDYKELSNSQEIKIKQKDSNIGANRNVCELGRIWNSIAPKEIYNKDMYNYSGYFLNNFINKNKFSSEPKIIKTISDQTIKAVIDKFYPLECEIAKKFLGRDELFLEKYPSIYGKEREFYKGIDLDMFNKFVEFLENDPLINKHKNTKSDEKKPNSINKKILKLVCCFVPNKELRKKIRGKK